MIPDSLSATEILRCTKPEHLFPVGVQDAIRKAYRSLARRWHPDRMGGDGDVFAHVTRLHTLALGKIANGLWEGSGIVTLETPGRQVALQVRKTSPFALGQTLISDHAVTFVLREEFASLYFHSIHVEDEFKYSSDRMKTEVQRYLPKQHWAAHLKDGRHVLQVEKTPDLLRLADVVEHEKGLDPKHVAWVVSSLLNLCCYLSYTELVHHDISPDTYYVSPRFHSGALLGGWWYHHRRGDAVTVLPRRTYDLLPFKARNTKTASALTDLELVRATGRECLAGKKAPKPMQQWLEDVGSGDAVTQYRQWLDVLKRAFGERRFVEMKLDADMVYGRQFAAHE